MGSLEGKVLIVTGAAQGIGQGIAVRAARHGATVVCADIQDDERTAKAVAAEGAPVTRMVMDVRKADDWRRLISVAQSEHGGVDLLANVAGVVNKLSADNVVDLTEEAWDDVLATDLNKAARDSRGCGSNGNPPVRPGLLLHHRPVDTRRRRMVGRLVRSGRASQPRRPVAQNP